MGGRRDDSARGRGALPPIPPRPSGGRPAPLAVVDEPPSAGGRGRLVVGALLAAAGTAAVVLTDNPLHLRVALLAVCWAFVGAAFLAGNRRADQIAAASREAELRHAYDRELEREVAARHEYEAELASRLRREAEDAMRAELVQLRTEIAGVSELRQDLAAVTQLRTDLAALTEIRAELAGLGELRSDLGRIRHELTEQLSGELFIERMVMRAQSVRGPVQSAPDPADDRTIDGGTSREPLVAGGQDIDRWDHARVVPAEPVEPAPRPITGPPPVPPPSTRTSARFGAESTARRLPPSPKEWLIEESVLEPWVEPRPKSPLEWLGDQSLLAENGRPTGELAVAPGPEPAPRRHRRAAEPDEESRTSPAWSAAPSYGTAIATSPDSTAYPSASSYDSSAYHDLLFGAAARTSAGSAGPVADELASDESASYESGSYGAPSYGSSSESPSSESPSSASAFHGSTSYGTSSYGTSSYGTSSYGTSSYGSAADSSGYRSSDAEPAGRSRPESSGHARLEQILAESGVEAPSGGRSRRRRYRDEDGETAGDDVLARVLGRE